jgi:hypothetical protein
MIGVMKVIYDTLRPRTICSGTKVAYETLLRARKNFDTVSGQKDAVEQLLVATLKEVNEHPHGS